jgi:signal peptidase I
MEPTLDIGDRIIVSKLSVEWGTINRGDILVFARPAADTADVCAGPPVNDLVKRVIGLPNEYLYNAGNSIYWSNGRLGPWHLIVEHWTHYLPLGTNIGSESSPAYVPPGHYYMLGDNENNSCDSRYWGPISRNLVVGKVILRILPLSRFDFL